VTAGAAHLPAMSAFKLRIKCRDFLLVGGNFEKYLIYQKVTMFFGGGKFSDFFQKTL